jgi:RNA polymerase sigma-70 factor (ECF subfamily)
VLLAVRDPKNSAAWAAFIGQYRDPIVRYCRRRFRMQDAACEDVAQDVVLKLIGVMQKFSYDPAKSFRGWLKTVTTNAVRDYLRAEGNRRDAAAADSRVYELLQSVPAAEVTEELSNLLSESLLRDLLADAERLVRDRVDSGTWRAYELRREDVPAKEVSAELGMKSAAVHKAFSRVKQMLREEVALLMRQPPGP